MIYYTIVSAWLCYYAGNPQFNYVICDHHKGHLLTVSETDNWRTVQGCQMIDYVWLPDEQEWWERTRAEIAKKRELEEK